VGNYYDLLEVARTATLEEIKKAYRKLAMKYHPDRNKGDKAAESKFKSINEAYETLKDPRMRTKYDEQIFANEEEDPWTKQHYEEYENRCWSTWKTEQARKSKKEERERERKRAERDAAERAEENARREAELLKRAQENLNKIKLMVKNLVYMVSFVILVIVLYPEKEDNNKIPQNNSTTNDDFAARAHILEHKIPQQHVTRKNSSNGPTISYSQNGYQPKSYSRQTSIPQKVPTPRQINLINLKVGESVGVNFQQTISPQQKIDVLNLKVGESISYSSPSNTTNKAK
jgi:curved DNA-binding protein CbpA